MTANADMPIDELRKRLKNIIVEQCNTKGCKECPYKWDGGCSATDLDGQIMKIEIGESNERVINRSD